MMKSKIVLLIVFSVCFTAFSYSQQITRITSLETEKLMKSDTRWVILDVRTAGEFNQGHVKGAINIDVHQPDAFDKYAKLDKNAKYIVYCRTQNRSGVVTNYMSQNGFKTIYQITDGITGWIMNNLPTVR